MKKIILLSFLSLAVLACKDDDDTQENEIVGVWRLIQINLDPGDGSGTFEDVETDKTIEFKQDGTIVSNGSICQASSETGMNSQGSYSLDDFIIISEDCVQTEFDITFQLVNSTVIVSYPCIEGCREKYVPLER